MKLGVPPNWLGKSFDWASKKIILSLRCFPKKKEEWTYKVAAFWPKGKNFIQYLSEFFPQPFWRDTQRNFFHFHI